MAISKLYQLQKSTKLEMRGLIMKIIDGLLRMILEAGEKKELLILSKSKTKFVRGRIIAIDPDLQWLLVETKVQLYDDDEKENPACILINVPDISQICYYKQNGVDIGVSK